MSIYITGTGSYIPELIKKNQQFLDNKFLNSDGSEFKVSNDILIKKFKEITGCPVLVNTSFNVRGEPIVCSIKDAFNCFMGTNLDILVCENFILYKNEQDKNLKKNYETEFELD